MVKDICLALCHACATLNPGVFSLEASKLGFSRKVGAEDYVNTARRWVRGDDRTMTSVLGLASVSLYSFWSLEWPYAVDWSKTLT